MRLPYWSSPLTRQKSNSGTFRMLCFLISMSDLLAIKQIKISFVFSMFLLLYSESSLGTDLLKAIFPPIPYTTQHSQPPPHAERHAEICKQTQAKPTRGGRQRTAGYVSTVHGGQCHSKWHEGKQEFKENKVVPLSIHATLQTSAHPRLPLRRAHRARGQTNAKQLKTWSVAARE